MEKPAETAYPIHDLLKRRWSPRAFDDRPVEPHKLRCLFEAARWAASAFNAQPWRFIVATKQDRDAYDRLFNCLNEGNRRWAGRAPVLMLSVAGVRDEDGDENRHAFHDVGQAAANLAIQATALGLVIHQMAGFDSDKAREAFGIPEGYEPVAAIAVGYPGNPGLLDERQRKRELAPRERNPLETFVFTDGWGKPSPLVSDQP